ncbi:hypothetical protein [Shewanella algae]|uniref:hypothetical protein n=1 Tax=Shewanella algae TaxID=38313 RepID=UPI0034D7456A
MIPNNTWVTDVSIAKYETYGLDIPKFVSDKPHELEIGPNNLNNSDGGLKESIWLFEFDGSAVTAAKYNSDIGEFEQGHVLFESSNIVNLSATFDQLGRPLVFYDTGSELFLYWYDPVLGDNTTTILGVGAYPFATFDMRWDTSNGTSDAILFYIRNGVIYYRYQRDRYSIEYQSPVTPYVDHILEADITVDYRLQVLYRYIDENYKPPTPQPPTQPDQPGSWSYFLNGYQSVIDFRADMLQLNTEFSIGIQLDSVELDKPDIALWSHQIAQVEGYSGGMMAVSFTGQSHNVVRVLYGGRVFESLAPFQLQPGHWLSEVTTEPTGTYLTVSVKPSGQSGYIPHRVKVSPNYESSEYSSLKIGAMSGTRGRMMNCLRGSISAVTVVTPTYASGLKLAMDHNSYPETGLPGELQPILNTDGSPSGMDNAIIRDYRPQNWAFNPD